MRLSSSARVWLAVFIGESVRARIGSSQAVTGNDLGIERPIVMKVVLGKIGGGRLFVSGFLHFLAKMFDISTESFDGRTA